MPSESPISPRIVLISFSDFLPKFLVFRSSASVFCTRSAIARMFGRLQAVRRPHRQLEFVDVAEQGFVDLGARQQLARLGLALLRRQGLGLALLGRYVPAPALHADLHLEGAGPCRGSRVAGRA